MKKIVKFFCAGVLISTLCAGFAGCNDTAGQEQKPNENEIQPVPVGEVGDEVAAFFNDYQTLQLIGSTIFEEVDQNGGKFIPQTKESCVVINNPDELPLLHFEAPTGMVDIEYPDINFNSHTLVIGVFGDKGGDEVKSKSLVFEQGAAAMNVTIGKRDDYLDHLYPAMTLPRFFWGMYPKIDAKTIEMNVSRKN